MAEILEIKNPNVVHESIDGEVVVINFENGCYYSLRDAAYVIWHLMNTSQLDIQLIVNFLSKKYNIDSIKIELEVSNFIEKLIEENLIKKTSVQCLEPANIIEPADMPKNYGPPKYEIYSDMKQTILLDPVHEVDNEGWPKKKI